MSTTIFRLGWTIGTLALLITPGHWIFCRFQNNLFAFRYLTPGIAGLFLVVALSLVYSRRPHL